MNTNEAVGARMAAVQALQTLGVTYVDAQEAINGIQLMTDFLLKPLDMPLASKLTRV